MARGGLQIDLVGRLRNFKLPPYRVLIPVFEAVVNALHAIEEAKRSNGRITIEVLRLAATAKGTQQNLPLPDGIARPPIIGFRIRDNGCGFTEENFTSFQTSDSTRKMAMGGRGVGRFTWLKVFEGVTVDSIYASEGQQRRRTFRFSEPQGVTEEKDRQCNGDPVPVETVVNLDGVKDPYSGYLPKKTATIAQHIVDHCFGAIRAASKPVRVELIDGDEDPVDLSAEVDRMFADALGDETEINGEVFTVTHIRVSSPEVAMHKLIFMGVGREVRSENLAKSIPQLTVGKLEEDGRGFWWWSLVESPALDDAVTPERDDFTIPTGEVLDGILSIAAIRDEVVPLIAARLAPFIEPIKEKTRDQVRRFVENVAPSTDTCSTCASKLSRTSHPTSRAKSSTSSYID